MRPRRFPHPRSARGFTLVEMMLVLMIIVLLSTLAAPSLQTARAKALSASCGSNLRQIGIAVVLATGDNNNRFPQIEGMPNGPTYTYPQTPGQPSTAKTMLQALGPYGVTAKVLKCPCDTPQTGAGGQSYFVAQGSSYQWRPFVDDEVASDPVVVFRSQVMPVSTTRMCVAFDFAQVHMTRSNRLYADGHVKWVTTPPVWQQ
jgi:prepilin-type N-terminal cleavage/methylation domain-containing protein/prepilin-type processing-associated H-X9-DG protein